MKKIATIICLALCCRMIVTAAPVTLPQAQKVAENFLHYTTGMTDAVVVSSYGAQERLANPWYLFRIQNHTGFVLISADDRFEPILAYSLDNNWPEKDLPENLNQMLAEYRHEMAHYIQFNAKCDPETRHKWGVLTAGEPLYGPENAVAPLLKSTWGQGAPYNAYCPVNVLFNQQAPTGCVATAMAQILRYWQYPEFGYGSHSYTPPLTTTQSANFGLTFYDWNDMALNNPPKPSPKIANLMYQCGVGVNMVYGATGFATNFSFAEVSNVFCVTQCGNTAEDALKNYFRYDPSLAGKLKSDYSNSQWSSLLKTELNAGRPVLYAATDDNNPVFGGHCFVVDGYSETGLFHINWGWDGAANGYYAINAFNADGHQYNSIQHAVFGIKPRAGATPPGNLSTTNITATSARISWNAAPGATGYYVELKPAGSSVWTHLGYATSANTTMTAQNLLPNTAYVWRIFAEYNQQLSNPSALKQFATPYSASAPANDLACSAQTLTASSSCNYVTGNLQYASASTYDYPCNYLPAADVWYKVTMPSSGKLTLRSTAGTLTDAVMSAYTGSNCNNLSLLACENDNNTSNKMPVMSFTGAAGTQLWVRMAGNYGASGNFKICALNYITSSSPGEGDLEETNDAFVPEAAPDRFQNLIPGDVDVVAETEPASARLDDAVDLQEGRMFSPNPASESITLYFQPDRPGNVAVEIIDLFGRKMLEKQYTATAGEQQETLRLEDLPNGAYWLRCRVNDAVRTQKLIVQK